MAKPKMTMKQYEASSADKKADKAALTKINSAKPKTKPKGKAKP